jgi:hypothetical protein
MGQSFQCNLKENYVYSEHSILKENSNSILGFTDKTTFAPELLAQILGWCECNVFMYFVSTCKDLRKKYILDSYYMLQYLTQKEQNGAQTITRTLEPTTLYKLLIVNRFKITIENKIINDANNHKLISALNQLSSYTNYPHVFNNIFITKAEIQIFNIIDSLIREKHGHKLSFHGNPSDNLPVIEFPSGFVGVKKAGYYVWTQPIHEDTEEIMAKVERQKRWDSFMSYLF